MKISKALIAAVAAAFLLSGCKSGDGNVFEDPFTIKESTADSSEAGSDSSDESGLSPEESRSEISENVKDVKLTSATEYYLSGQQSNFVTACKALVKGARAFESNISVRGLELNKEDLSELIVLATSAEPDLWMVDPAYAYSSDKDNVIKEVSFKYTLSQKDYDKASKKLHDKAESIIAETAGRSDFEKLRIFHDRIISGCEYSDSSKFPYSAYGCLVEGKSVCEGYSKAFGMLCDMAGIQCIPVLGKANDGETEAHMWNKVQLDNEWYNVDITWDDPVSEIGRDYIGNSYFGVTDEVILRDHTPEESRLLKYPKATGTKYNYFVAADRYIEDADDADSILLVAITAQASAGSKYVQLKCSDKKVFDEVMSREFSGGGENPHIFEILASASKASGNAFSPDSYSITKNERMLTFTLILNM